MNLDILLSRGMHEQGIVIEIAQRRIRLVDDAMRQARQHLVDKVEFVGINFSIRHAPVQAAEIALIERGADIPNPVGAAPAPRRALIVRRNPGNHRRGTADRVFLTEARHFRVERNRQIAAHIVKGNAPVYG